MRSAGTASSAIRSRLAEGKVKGGRDCGTAPTIFTPAPSSPKRPTTSVVAATAAAGPALAAISARRGWRPARISAGFSPLRTQNRNAVAMTPITSVIRLIPPRPPISDEAISGSVCPWASTPRTCLSWLTAISRPEAVMNPAITGCDRKFATKPSRNSPIASSIAPDSPASVSAATA